MNFCLKKKVNGNAIKYFLFIVLFSFQNLSAQNYVDIARVYFNTTEQNKFDNSSSQSRISEFGVDLTYPIVMKKSTMIIGLIAESTDVRLVEFDNTTRLSSYTARLGFNKTHSEKWSGTYLVIPKLASDFRKSSKENFQIGALALLKYVKTESLNYKIGLYYNSELFGTLISPIFGFYYGGPTKKFEANLLLPSIVDFNYRLLDWFQVGLNFTGQIRSYRLSSSINNTQSMYVAKTSNEICGYLKFNLSKSISIFSRLGYSVGRSYRVFDVDDKVDFAISLIKIGNNRTQLNTDFADGLLFQTILLYRFIQK